MRHLRFLSFLPLLGITFLLSSCQGYKLGSQLPSDIRSVYVPTVRNLTTEPLLENEVTQAVLNELQRDGSLSIQSEETADAILTVSITDYQINPLSFQPGNRSLPDEYRLVLNARVEMVRRDNGKILARNSSVSGRDDFRLFGDLTSAKRDESPPAQPKT